MNAQHALRALQGALVVGALAFAGLGFGAPQQHARQAACPADTGRTVLAPVPPCECYSNLDCVSLCGTMTAVCDLMACDGGPNGGVCACF